MSSEQPKIPRCEIGYLNYSKDSRTKKVDYIVARTIDNTFKIFADSNWYMGHRNVHNAMLENGSLSAQDHIVGGGRLVTSVEDGTTRVFLEGRSSRYGQEPQEVRDIFRGLLTQKFQEMGIAVS